MSEWQAINSLDDAYGRTIDLLFRPFKLKLWLKIALIVLLVSGLSSLGSNTNYRADEGDISPDNIAKFFWIIVVLVFVIIIVALILWFISSVLEFVFVESVIEKKAEIVDGFKRMFGKGFNLFVFRLALGVVLLLIVIAIVLGFAFIIFSEKSLSVIVMSLVGVFLLSIFAFFLILVGFFTSDFVVPLMYLKGLSVISGWRRLWGLIRKEPLQFVVYVLVKLVLGAVGLFITTIVAVILLLTVLFFVGLIGIVVYGLVSILGLISLVSSKPLMIVLTVVGVILFTIGSFIVSYIATCLTLPIPVFFRYYSIMFLQRVDTEPEKPAKPKMDEKGSGEEIRIY